MRRDLERIILPKVEAMIASRLLHPASPAPHALAQSGEQEKEKPAEPDQDHANVKPDEEPALLLLGTTFALPLDEFQLYLHCSTDSLFIITPPPTFAENSPDVPLFTYSLVSGDRSITLLRPPRQRDNA